MVYDKTKDFVLNPFGNLSAQWQGTAPQVPFSLGLKNSPSALRRVLEVLMVVWTVTDVANSASHTVGVDDVVILAGHSSTITLPTLAAGRMLVVKDKSGAAGTSGQAITINRAGSSTIDGSNTSFSLNANYGAVMFIGGNGTEWHSIALV
jgi:hypothetical protein|tara:strand:- start:1492 stop:1941 length:450 start_codon:yes stop_codon:yes gene_type:complete